ncbi:MAG: serine/threonine protein kinase [Planctomycetes bacterium]|nr:serine/threonine protein kinase [Planctomycetota bacterium]
MARVEKFRLVRLLGQGGFGTTYLADVLDSGLAANWGPRVVLKMPRDLERGLALIQGDYAQNSIARALSPATDLFVRTLGFEIFDGQYVLCVEYLPRSSLRDRLGELGHARPIPGEEGIAVIGGIAAGVAVLHRAAILHRDLSPDNILFDASGRPKIGDFGLAERIEPGARGLAPSGKVLYLAPEGQKGEPISFPSDVFSLGLVFYEVLTGIHPFLAQGNEEVRLRVLREDPPSPHEIAGGVDPGLSRLVARMLDKDPAKRPGTGEAVRRELDDVLHPASSSRPARAPQEAKNGRRGPDESGPLNAEECLERCRALNQSGRFEEATLLLDRSIATAPEHGLLHWQRAIALRRLERGLEAYRALEDAIGRGLPESIEREARRLLDLWGQQGLSRTDNAARETATEDSSED